ncbi:Hemolysin, chromosomal [Falsiruegeria litorea R37]|uniref:Hemolysin, chromosomal n=1 Tax=Falsiruegeria litorea R37 TaxID=1200284 RepID=A0A1Y5RSU7_9RHOB|nr:Ig-like domain-containing protein [Falsiruegeria litorea]SLN24684.1 Hemolysin, chromosomal [Falsiruegeria litorea R37]
MARDFTTDTEIFAAYEAYARDVMSGQVSLDLTDVRLYGVDASTMSASEAQADFTSMAAMLLFGEQGVGGAAPSAVRSVREFELQLAEMFAGSQGLSTAGTQPTASELQARAATLADNMLAEFDAAIAQNASNGSILPSTDAEQDLFRGSIGEAMRAMTEARDVYGNILSGQAGAADIGVAAAATLRAATTLLSALPLPPAAKAAANVVNIATYLVPGIIAAAKGDGDPTELFTIAVQTVTSILTWGVSDYVFDYILPIAISAGVNALDGSGGQVDLSPTAISQGLIEAAVHNNGGTLPDWWYTAGGSDGEQFNQAADQARTIASALTTMSTNLWQKIAAQYGDADFYQELTLTLHPNLGPQKYIFARVNGTAYRPAFIDFFDGTTDPWSMIEQVVGFNPFTGSNYANAATDVRTGDALYILEHGTAQTSFSDNRDTVITYEGQSYSLLGGDDRFVLRQDVDGRPGNNSSNHYATAVAATVDGGDGTDVLDLTALTGSATAGHGGDLIVTSSTVSIMLADTSTITSNNTRVLVNYTNFEGIEVGDLRLADFRDATKGIKLSTVDSTTSTDATNILGSDFGDTFIIDTSRLINARVSNTNNGLVFSHYSDTSQQLVTVDAGAGHDYVAGELVNGATYYGGSGVDTFEILLPDNVSDAYFFTSLDLETGASRLGWAFKQDIPWLTTPPPDLVEHIDTGATVQGFEWAVGSAASDVIYAANAGSRILGQAGDDQLVGRSGNDQLLGGLGNDTLSGGEGVNRLEGGEGDDIVTSGAAQDVILGGLGNDHITDAGGDNLIVTGQGNDTVIAGSGNDEIMAASGNNVIDAGDGDNTVTGGGGNDSVTTGTGSDVVRLGAGLDHATTGEGDDHVTDILAFDPWTVASADRALTGALIDTGGGYDVVTLDAAGETVRFEDHARFNAERFDYDILMGSRFIAGQQFTPDETGVSGTYHPIYDYDEVRNAEEIILTNGTFVVDLISYADLGEDFRSTIDRYNIHNTVQTWDNDDLVNLGAGNDRFYVNLGNDTVDGEEGTDTLDFSRLAAGHTFALSATTTTAPWSISIFDSSGALVGSDTAAGFENVVGTGQDDVIVLDDGANVITGGAGDDTLTGGAGADRYVFGTNDGNDTLTDLALGEVLEFHGTGSSASPAVVRTGSEGSYAYVVTFDQTTVRFSSADLLDLNMAATQTGGLTIWTMEVVDGAVKATDDAGTGYETDEDTVLITADTLLNDIDPGVSDAAIVAFATTSARGASVAWNADSGTFTYDPSGAFDYLAVGESTTDTFTYTLGDGVTTSTATVTLVVNGVNDAPTLGADTATVNEDAVIDIDVLANDTDTDTSDILTVTSVTDGAHGTVTLNDNGTVRYAPAADFYGTDSFTYTVSDGQTTVTETVTVTVAPQPDAIAATPDPVNLTVINGNRTVALSPLANDSHADGTLSITGVGQPGNGSATLNADGTVSYTANAGFAGEDSFTYTILSTSGATTTETVTVTVQTNLAPVAGFRLAPRGTEDSPITIDPLSWASDPNGDALSLVSVGPAWNGAAQVTLNENGTVTVTPNADYNGYIDFYYTITDGELETRSFASVFFENTQDAPVGVDDHIGVDPEARSWLNVLGNDTDADRIFPGNQMEARLITGVTAVGDTADNATFELGNNGIWVTPNPGFIGTLTFTYTLRDSGGLTSSATATVYVSTLPQLIADGYAIQEDSGQHIFDVLANDSDVDSGQTLTITAVSGAVGGTVTIVDGGKNISYTPNADFTGVETLTYTVSDGLREASQTITVTVNNTADTPVAGDDAVTTAEDTAVTIDVLANDSDPGTAVLTIAAVGDATHGQVTISGGQLIYTPNADFFGTDTFTYDVSDGAGGIETATVTVTVTAENDAPVAADISATIQEDGTYSFNPLAAASDVDGDTVSLVRVGTAAHGLARLNEDGSVSYTPVENYAGSDSFTYVITDGVAETVVTVTLTVAEVNDAPVALNDAATLQEDGTLTFDVVANDSDVDGQSLTIISVSDPAHGQASFDGQTITYTPNANFHGTEVITYVISDGAGGTSSATLDVVVTPVADAPVVVNDTSTGQQSEVQNVNVLANDTDADGDVVRVVSLNGTAVTANDLVELPSGAFVQLNADGTVSYLPLDAFRDLNASGVATETVTYAIQDSTGRVSEGTVTFTINGENDAPVAIDFTQPSPFAERSVVSIAAGSAFRDADAGDVLTFSATLADGTPLPAGLEIDSATGLITGTLPANSSGTSGADSVLTIRVTADDGTDTGTLDVQITLQNVNDAPTFDTPPTRLEVTSDAETALDLSGLNLADVDSPVVTLTLSVDAGHLTATGVTGVSVATVNGALALTGTPAALNAFLAGGVKFVDPADVAGGLSAQLTMTLTDDSGAELQEIGPVPIDVTNVDDITRVAGTLTAQSGAEDTAIALDFSGVTLTDTDGLTVTLSGVPASMLSAVAATGITIATSSGDSLTLSGSTADISAYLATIGNITFTPPPNANGTFGPLVVTATGLDGSNPVTIGEIGLEITPVDDPVTIGGLAANQAHIETVVSTPAEALTASAVDYDLLNGGQGDYSGTSVVVSARAGDAPIFGIGQSELITTQPIDGTSWALIAGGERFGTFRLDTTNGNLTARFDFGDGAGTPTTDLVNAALQLVTFETGQERLYGFGTTELTWSFLRADETVAQTAHTAISVQFIDDPVTISLPETPITLAEGDSATAAFAGVELFDPDLAGNWTMYFNVEVGELSIRSDHGLSALVVQTDPQGGWAFGGDMATASQVIQSALLYTAPDELTSATTTSLTIRVVPPGHDPAYGFVFEVPIALTPVNDAAQFSGDLTAAMNEDGTTLSGQIVVSDIDGPDALIAGRVFGAQGFADVTADGQWHYTLTGLFPNLDPGQSVTDTLMVTAADGTQHALSIQINGVSNSFQGTSAADELIGTRLDDTFQSSAGDDVIRGGSGLDTVLFTGAADEFVFHVQDGALVVTDTARQTNGDEGANTLFDIEVLDFADVSLDVNVTKNGGETTSVIVSNGGNTTFSWALLDDGRKVATTFENGQRVGQSVTDGVGANDTATWSQYVDTFNADGTIATRQYAFDAGGSRTDVFEYENGQLTGRTATDGAGEESTAAWSQYVDTYNADGTLATRQYTFDAGGNRSEVFEYENGQRTGRTVTDGAGEESTATWSQYVDTFNADGTIATRQYAFDAGGSRTDVFEYENGQLTGRTATDGAGEESTAAWSQYVDTYNADGTLATRQYTFDAGGNRSEVFEYENGQRTGRTVTDGAGEESTATWSQYVDTFNADGTIATRQYAFDAGGSRTDVFEYENGQFTGRTATDGVGANNSADWSQYVDTFNPDGTIATRQYTFDAGGSTSTVFEYENGQRTGRTVTDGVGANNSADWSQYVDTFDTNGYLELRTLLMDNGDQIETKYVGGIRAIRTTHDLSESADFETQTEYFDSTGALLSVEHVWDIV